MGSAWGFGPECIVARSSHRVSGRIGVAGARRASADVRCSCGFQRRKCQGRSVGASHARRLRNSDAHLRCATARLVAAAARRSLRRSRRRRRRSVRTSTDGPLGLRASWRRDRNANGVRRNRRRGPVGRKGGRGGPDRRRRTSASRYQSTLRLRLGGQPIASRHVHCPRVSGAALLSHWTRPLAPIPDILAAC